MLTDSYLLKKNFELGHSVRSSGGRTPGRTPGRDRDREDDRDDFRDDSRGSHLKKRKDGYEDDRGNGRSRSVPPSKRATDLDEIPEEQDEDYSNYERSLREGGNESNSQQQISQIQDDF